MTRVIVCCGAGGVGKTTVSAALAVSMALSGLRVVVLTIDPARRLADALGVAALGNQPQPVDLTPLRYSGTGSLDALMLDRKQTFDDAIRRFCEDPSVADRLLHNRYYLGVSTRLSGSHEYMATEKLQQLVESGRWDVVVLDTPPAQHAIDFFTAPERLSRLFEHGGLAVVLKPGWGLMEAASRPALRIVARIAGDTVLQEIAEFFRMISGFSKVIRQRHREVQDLLRSRRSAFYVVTVPQANASEDIATFTRVLSENAMRLSGLIVNRVVQAPPTPGPLDLSSFPAPPNDVSASDWRATIEALLLLPDRLAAIAQHDASAIARLKDAAGGVRAWTLPELPFGAGSLESLAGLAPRLPEPPGATF